LQKKQNDELGTPVFAVGRLNVAGIKANIVHSEATPPARRVTRNALKQLHLRAYRNGFFLVHAKHAFQLRRLLVP
jgi:hypothetical protein